MLAAGKAADIVLIDAPDGGTQDDALAAIRNGDIAAVGAVITGGDAALRRPEPQHAGDDAQGAGGEVHARAGALWKRALACQPRRQLHGQHAACAAALLAAVVWA